MREAGTAPAERVPTVVRFERVVIAVWEEPVTVAAVPVTLPVTFPVSAPKKLVAVIEGL